MSLATTHSVVGSLADGKKIVKTVLTGDLGASGGIYIGTASGQAGLPLSKVTDVLSIRARGGKTKLVMQFCPVVTSGNQVVIYAHTMENAGLSGTAWVALASGDCVSGSITLYTLGV